ncbi:SGNH/GDSL hydrolase family protein [Nocardioides sp. dk4132]|uniref:SGNH/GDSL hydrolase family protein n=1 Tax=unclassified Nocardioides TaxID=2615069 RepID=UPI0012978CE2|nr:MULTISPECIES: SGNH/GDSL hydrolase family protein [unclassified Nocardioides]MQW75856.1 SGNH/GDSL hydrolase family protein [Nocardioides sp. dk4132]QGA08724.1 SGNH/GDSL hydrolase family protein [Nocardioides sp. dk884]
MGKAAAARKLASAAAYGGGGLTMLGGTLYGVLTAEAKLARKAIGPLLDDPPPDPTGWYGRDRPGPAVKLVVLGDSSAAGYGVARVEETPGALMASGVAEHAERRVYLRDLAVVGAKSSDLAEQVDKALPIQPDVAVILIGGNDVTHTVMPSASVRHLQEAVRRLRAADVEVVVGTCPDLGTIKPIAPPLKQIARAWSRRLAAGQTIAAIEEGGRTVSIGSILGPEFAAAPALLFGPDRFHPSAQGYRAAAGILLPSILAAVGVIPDDEERIESMRGEAILPISKAAVQAVNNPGTELDGTEVGGHRLGVRGLWVEMRHRGRRPQTRSEGPEPTGPEQIEPENAPAGGEPTPAGS